MNPLIGDQLSDFIAVIEQQGVPALRVGFTLAVIVFLLAGVFIWRRRHQFFDRDPDVENDVPVVRHNREEEICICLDRADTRPARHLVPGMECMT
jgi:hypothetical protein